MPKQTAMTLPGGATIGRLLAITAALLLPLLTGCATPPASAPTPPAPDYAQTAAWLAWPGQDGRERSTPPALKAVDEASAPADVFFIHPTTVKGRVGANASWNVSDQQAPLNPPVLLAQASVFNGCCRIYAPRYRQASLKALDDRQAMALAYADIAAAFAWYMQHENKGRALIIASHSQGTMHAVRLMQDAVLDKPVQRQLVAAYLIGSYVPDTFGELGLPICSTATQTGCVVTWNSSEGGRRLARRVIDDWPYWWRGELKTEARAAPLCVNPLTWTQQGVAEASANPGSLRFPLEPYAPAAVTLPALVPALTGARCRDGMLEIALPRDAPEGFRNTLSRLTGSQHLNDYGLFYRALRDNTLLRISAWETSKRP